MVAGIAASLAGCGPQASTAPVAAPVAGTTPTAPPGYTLVPIPAAGQQPAGQPVPPPVAYQTQPQPVAPAQAPQQLATAKYAPQPQYVQTSPQVVVEKPVRAVNTALHGEIRGIEAIHEKPAGTGKGAVVGGVLGAVIGNRFGHGTGRAVMTGVGAAGGAYAGNTVERNMNEQVVGYRVSVRLDNGQTRSFEEPQLDGLRIGDRVHVDGNRLRRG